MTVAIKIRHTHHLPTRRKSRPGRGADESVVFQVPKYRLSCASIVKDIIGPPIAVKVSWRGRGRIHQVVANDIEIDRFGRCKSDVGILAWTTKCVLHVWMRLRAGRAQPITEVAGRSLIEIDNLAGAAIDREIARAARSQISRAGRGPTEQVLRPEIAVAGTQA